MMQVDDQALWAADLDAAILEAEAGNAQALARTLREGRDAILHEAQAWSAATAERRKRLRMFYPVD